MLPGALVGRSISPFKFQSFQDLSEVQACQTPSSAHAGIVRASQIKASRRGKEKKKELNGDLKLQFERSSSNAVVEGDHTFIADYRRVVFYIHVSGGYQRNSIK
jgi:hypothetical protein